MIGSNATTSATFLLGAGVSLRAGMPGVQDISNAVLCGRGRRGEFYRHSSGVYHSSEAPESAHQARVDATHGREPGVGDLLPFLQNVRDRVQTYFGEYSKDRTANYEDIAYLVTQVADAEGEEYENPALGPLIHELRHGLNSQFDLHKISHESAEYIRWVVADLLSVSATRFDHLPSLVEACRDPEITPVHVFTLNHDTLIEQVLRGNAIDFTDGFEAEGHADCRYWSPGLFQEPLPKVRVLKLHGGLDWFRFRSETGNDQRLAIAINRDLDHTRDAWARPQTLLSTSPEILLGTFNKMLDYTGGAFADLFCHFRRTLSRASFLVVSGYSFRDKGINGVIVEWIRNSPHRKLVIVHPQYDRYAAKARGAVRSLFSNNRSQIRGVPLRMEDAHWSDVVSVLN